MTATHAHTDGASAPPPIPRAMSQDHAFVLRCAFLGRSLGGELVDEADRRRCTRLAATLRRWGALAPAPATALTPHGDALLRAWDAREAYSTAEPEQPAVPVVEASPAPAETEPSPRLHVALWWGAVCLAPDLPRGTAMAEPPRPQSRPYQADLFGPPADLVWLSPPEAREVRLTAGVRLVAETLAGFGHRDVSVTFGADRNPVTLVGGREATVATVRQALRVLLARGFLRVEHGGRGEPNTYSLTRPEV